MKELSIEEKAKAYDEALKVLHKYDGANIMFSQDLKEEMFPELKEPEDDRVRKAIINHFEEIANRNEQSWINLDIPYILDWLKRQGDKFQYWKPSEEQLEALDYAYNLCPDTERGNYYEGVLETLIDDLYKLSEKKRENKPDDKIEPIFKVGDTIHYKEEDTIFPMVIDRISGGYYECDGGKCCININFQDYYELVKQTSTLSEEDEEHVNSLLKRLEGLCRKEFTTTRFAINEDEDWLKSLKYRVQPKQELSKEDEIAIDDALWCCKQAASIAKDENDMGNAWYAEHWLKTLKYKTHSLPQQEWGEEVEAAIRLLKGITEEQEKDYCPYNANNLRKAAQYLETCRPQTTWKPSNEQLEALEHSLGDYNITIFEDRHKILKSLYQDLKKLKKLNR